MSLPAGAYDVLVGPDLLPAAADLIAARLGRAQCAIVTDDNVAAAGSKSGPTRTS